MLPKRSLWLACLLATTLLLLVESAPALSEGEDPSRPRVEVPDIDKPSKGMTMAEVRERYGDPKEEVPPVGDPPISRWVYEQYTVYFENHRVLHSVIPNSLKIRAIGSHNAARIPAAPEDIFRDREKSSTPFD